MPTVFRDNPAFTATSPNDYRHLLDVPSQMGLVNFDENSKITLQKSAPVTIAALSSQDRECNALLLRLQKSGHLITSFLDVPSLLDVLATGQRFDLLVVPLLHEETEWGRIASASTVLCMPILVIAQPDNLKINRLPREILEGSALSDIASSIMLDAEIDWRIRSLLQKTGAFAKNKIDNHDFALGEYKFLVSRRIVLHRGRFIRLQPLQFEVAQALFRNVGHVVTRSWLLSSLWGIESPNDGVRVLDVCVASLRKKLVLRPENGCTICSIYKYGYILFQTDRAPVASDESSPDG